MRNEKGAGIYHSSPGRTAPPVHRSGGEWCNGNTTVFGTVILGSSPSSPAIGLQKATLTGGLFALAPSFILTSSLAGVSDQLGFEYQSRM